MEGVRACPCVYACEKKNMYGRFVVKDSFKKSKAGSAQFKGKVGLKYWPAL